MNVEVFVVFDGVVSVMEFVFKSKGIFVDMFLVGFFVLVVVFVVEVLKEVSL